MSIILEALKKATKKEADITVETTKEPSESELKNPEVQTPNFNTSLLGSPTSIFVAIILIGGFLLYIIFGGRDVSTVKHLKPKSKIPSSELAATPNLVPEGYVSPKPILKQKPAPINIFKPIISNPRLTLNGIIYGFGKPAAIIENEILEEGGSIRGAKVVKIYNDRVELLNESSGEIFILKVR